MSDKGQREWRFYIGDMERFARNALDYTKGLDQAAFVTDRRTYDATLCNLELIGEAATHVPEEIRKAHPEIPWRLIIATQCPNIRGLCSSLVYGLRAVSAVVTRPHVVGDRSKP